MIISPTTLEKLLSDAHEFTQRCDDVDEEIRQPLMDLGRLLSKFEFDKDFVTTGIEVAMIPATHQEFVAMHPMISERFAWLIYLTFRFSKNFEHRPERFLDPKYNQFKASVAILAFQITCLARDVSIEIKRTNDRRMTKEFKLTVLALTEVLEKLAP